MRIDPKKEFLKRIERDLEEEDIDQEIAKYENLDHLYRHKKMINKNKNKTIERVKSRRRTARQDYSDL